MKIKKRTLEKVRKWFLVFLVVVLLSTVYRLYVDKEWFTITSYTIVGVDDASVAQILPRLKRVSSGTSLFILPHDKILSYSYSDIANEISEVVPSRKNILIRPSSRNTLRIEVEEFVPVMKLSDGNAVTKDGIVFSTKQSLDAFPLFDTSASTTTFKESGFTFKRLASFDGAYIERLSSFLEKVSTVLFPITKIAIDDVGDVRLYGDNNAEILLTKDIDLIKGWSTLVSAIDTDPLKSSLETSKEKLLYIDLRFGNKVFYKFNNGAFQNSSTTVIIDGHATQATTTVR